MLLLLGYTHDQPANFSTFLVCVLIGSYTKRKKI